MIYSHYVRLTMLLIDHMGLLCYQKVSSVQHYVSCQTYLIVENELVGQCVFQETWWEFQLIGTADGLTTRLPNWFHRGHTDYLPIWPNHHVLPRNYLVNSRIVTFYPLGWHSKPTCEYSWVHLFKGQILWWKIDECLPDVNIRDGTALRILIETCQ